MNSLLSGAQMLELDPNDIDDSGRIGFFYPDKAAALGRLMKVDGQRTPISVTKGGKGSDKPWKLVVGMHRTAGARLEGIPVYAVEVTGRPEDLADQEASENLHRRRLEPLERAKFTAALVQAAQERIARENGNLKQQQLAIRARWQRVKAHEIRPDDALTEEVNDTCAKIAHVYGWEESAGEALGMSRRSIHNDLQLFRLLIEPFPDLIEALAAHPVVGSNASQLKMIATIREEDMRRRAIEALLADAEMSADQALIAAGVPGDEGRKPSDEEKKAQAAIGNLGRLTAPQQKRYVSQIVSVLKSDEVKRQLRDTLNEQLGAPAAIDLAFQIVTSLIDGEPVGDVQLEDAADKLQRLMAQAGGAD
jgi:hypothetical protein